MSRNEQTNSSDNEGRSKGSKMPEWLKNFDRLTFRSCEAAERACRINFSINIVMVGVGISLLAYSMAYGAIKGLDIYSTAFGSLGVVSFVSIFFLTPQSKIFESVSDLVQIQILYRSYIYITDLLQRRTWYNQELSAEEIEKTSKEIEKTTFNIVEKMEVLVGKREKEPNAKKKESGKGAINDE